MLASPLREEQQSRPALPLLVQSSSRHELGMTPGATREGERPPRVVALLHSRRSSDAVAMPMRRKQLSPRTGPALPALHRSGTLPCFHLRRQTDVSSRATAASQCLLPVVVQPVAAWR